MFNKNFNLTAAVNDLPVNLRKSVLFSLVGSLNTRVFKFADNCVVKLLADGFELNDICELHTRQLIKLFDGVDDTSSHHDAMLIASLAQEWRDQLQKVSANPEAGLMIGTIEMMVGQQKPRVVTAKGKLALASLGIVRTPEERMAMLMQKLDTDQARANERARRVGFTEYIIDRVLTPATDGETEHYAEVSDELKEQLCDKFMKALQKAKQTAIDNVELDVNWGDSLGALEIVHINKVFDGLANEIYPTSTPTPTTEPTSPGPTARRIIQPKAFASPALPATADVG